MPAFKTSDQNTWIIDITTGKVMMVKNLCQYPDGKPVDIFEAVETGILSGISGDIKTLVDVTFVLCLDQVKEKFDLAAFDAANKSAYEFFPDQAAEPVLTKASRWFGSLVDGDTLLGMIEAFHEAVVNFIPNGNRRQALRTILDREKEIANLESELRITAANRYFDRARAGVETRMEKLVAREEENLEAVLDGHFWPSGNTPESSREKTTPTAVSGS